MKCAPRAFAGRLAGTQEKRQWCHSIDEHDQKCFSIK